MFCIVTVIRVDLHVMYCDSDTFTFCTVIIVFVYVFYCDSIVCTCFVL
jgi:hypothetical protein